MKNGRLSISTFTGIALCVLTLTLFGVALGSHSEQPSGRIKVNGTVKIDGRAAAEGDTVSSGSTVETAKGSSAVVSLGKLGRVEVHENTNMKLTLEPFTVTAMLSQGRVRVSSSSGVSAKVDTSDAEVLSVGSNEYVVDVTCGNTFVAVKRGTVELRAGSTVKQIAAGNQDTAGVGRPGCKPRG